VKEYVKILDSIRIGAFTVKHVRCTIPSGTAEGADLLGNEFQHLFQFKLDINNQTLQLSPLDSQAVTIEAPSKNPPVPAVTGGPGPMTPGSLAPPVANPLDPAPETAPVGHAGTITVKYATGDTELATLKESVKYFSNRDYPLESLPDELDGLTFTRREAGTPSQLDIWIPKGLTVYLLIDSDKSGVHNTAALNDALQKQDWTRLDDAECMIEGKQPYIAIYKKTETANRRYHLAPATWAGLVVAAKNLEVNTTSAAPPEDSAAQPAKAPAKLPANAVAGDWFEPSSGSTTTLNADGTAKSKDGTKGTWTANDDGTVIEIKWADDTSDIYRLSHGKWTRYAYEDGKLQSKDEISPP
jgi:hypothetical protein